MRSKKSAGFMVEETAARSSLYSARFSPGISGGGPNGSHCPAEASGALAGLGRGSNFTLCMDSSFFFMKVPQSQQQI
jgi:hypothetical protein